MSTRSTARWGALLVSEALLARATSWTPAQQARLHSHLADSARMIGDEATAGEHALRAVALDPSSPSRLAAARRLLAIAAPDRARALLLAAPTPWQPWQVVWCDG